MSEDTLTVAVADSTRLGTHMLEKILEPYVELDVCRDDPTLNQLLAKPNAPRLCLVSYLWPEIDVLLEQLSRHRPAIPAVLLASPDSDAEALARLSETYDCGILYRPYEPTQAIREVLHQLSKKPATSEPVPPTLDVEPDIAEAEQETTEPYSAVEMLTRDQAFCRRHHLPHSILAIRIQDLDNLCRELGNEICDEALDALVLALNARLRQEDALILSDRQNLVLTLPGTPPLGARVLAHRLCAWLQREEFRIHEFRIHFTIAAGIHCLTQDNAEDAEQALQEALGAATLAHASPHSSAVHLSDTASEQAMHHLHHPEPEDKPDEAEAAPEEEPQLDAVPMSEADPERFWETVETILTEETDSTDSDRRKAVLKRLTNSLRLLSENERMALVDELLLASAQP